MRWFCKMLGRNKIHYSLCENDECLDIKFAYYNFYMSEISNVCSSAVDLSIQSWSLKSNMLYRIVHNTDN